MFLFPKKTTKVPATAAPQYELSDEVKERIRADILQKERLLQHARAVKEYEAQVRAEVRRKQGYVCTCDSVDALVLGCDVHDN